MHPQLADLIQVCARHGVGHVVLAGGLPPAPAIEAVKAFGAKLICFTPALSLGKKLLRSGVDALVIEGMEAGGHIGAVSTQSEERRVGKEWVSPCRSRWAPDH